MLHAKTRINHQASRINWLVIQSNSRREIIVVWKHPVCHIILPSLNIKGSSSPVLFIIRSSLTRIIYVPFVFLLNWCIEYKKKNKFGVVGVLLLVCWPFDEWEWIVVVAVELIGSVLDDEGDIGVEDAEA